MVPPERRRARDARKGEREDGSPALRAAVRPRGVAAPRPCERPCAPRPAEPHIPRATAHCPRPAARSATPLQLPGSRKGRWGGRGRGGAQGGGPERGGHTVASATAPGAPASRKAGARAQEEGTREGDGEGAGRAGRPLRAVGWTSPAAHPQDLSPRRRPHPRRTRAASHSRPLAAGRRCQPLTEAGGPRRRAARSAGSDGSGSCHVEGGGEVVVGVEDEGAAWDAGSGVPAKMVQAGPLEPRLRTWRWPGNRFPLWLRCGSPSSPLGVCHPGG